MLLLMVHEMGHVIQLRREGVPASAPMFIPFMGAFVGMKEMPKNAWAEAKVGLAGPVLGPWAQRSAWAWRSRPTATCCGRSPTPRSS